MSSSLNKTAEIEADNVVLLVIGLYLLAIFWCYKEIVSRRFFSHFVIDVVTTSISIFLLVSPPPGTVMLFPDCLLTIFVILLGVYLKREEIGAPLSNKDRLVNALRSIMM